MIEKCKICDQPFIKEINTVGAAPFSDPDVCKKCTRIAHENSKDF